MQASEKLKDYRMSMFTKLPFEVESKVLDPNKLTMEVIKPHLFVKGSNNIPLVDRWDPLPEDEIVKKIPSALYMPIAEKLGQDPELNVHLDIFNLKSKRGYSIPKANFDMQEHFCKYINYFEKFYDPEHELLAAYAYIKATMDAYPQYNKANLEWDIRRLILDSNIGKKVKEMNDANCVLELRSFDGEGRNIVLNYNNQHVHAMMEVSLFQVILIPLLTHFAFHRQVANIDEFLIYFYNILLREMHPEMDLVNKLYQTVMNGVMVNYKRNTKLWVKLEIAAVGVHEQAANILNNVIIQLFPKYTYIRNVVHFNHTSIEQTLSFKIVDGKYDYVFNRFNHDKRDDESSSDLDIFEAHMSKRNESLLLHNQVNYERVMETIDNEFGPFDPEEIAYYQKELSKDAVSPVNELQRELVSYLFLRYFGDPSALKSLTLTGYIKLIIASRKILCEKGLYTMAAILSGKVVKRVNRNSVNKKESTKIQSSPEYRKLIDRYKSEKTENYIMALLSTILSSKFTCIDYHNQENTGAPIMSNSDVINDEFLRYVLMIG